VIPVIPGCPARPLSGGSASLMAHGMAVKPGRSHQALLWTWEAQRNWALEATKNLQAQHGPAAHGEIWRD